MSTGYGWEGIRQVCATMLGARHVPERLCGGSVYPGRYNKCSTFYLYTHLVLGMVFRKGYCISKTRTAARGVARNLFLWRYKTPYREMSSMTVLTSLLLHKQVLYPILGGYIYRYSPRRYAPDRAACHCVWDNKNSNA